MEYGIQVTFSHPAGEVAAAELRRGLELALGGPLTPSATRRIMLSVEPFLPAGEDGYRLDVSWQGKEDRIVGSNPRSVLFGVCRLLHELGFRWVRPGADGEVVPHLETLPPVHLEDKAGYRFRGICIEGSDSQENVMETLEWMCRHGMNTYFIQFRNGYCFFQRWYEHEGNPLLPQEPYDAAAITAAIRREVKRRGLELQMVGHGWTCDPFGLVDGKGWYECAEPPPEVAPLLAMVKGKRKLQCTIALFTNLCYSNPDVRRRIVTAIVDYARQNPDVDVIHFWLADGSNNSCECDACRVKRPSDWYAQMLNDLDAEMTRQELPTRIVFLVYSDLLWPPEQIALPRSGRFILMFAPISRTYSSPLPTAVSPGAEIPPFRLNNAVFSHDPQINMLFLRGWQRLFDGAGFDFDYHYMWDHYKDNGYYDIARVMQEDCRNLRDMGLDGLVDCQVQRVFFPNGLGMAAMAETLWNPQATFDDIARRFFTDAYGPADGAAAQAYFRAVSALFQPRLVRNEGTAEECRELGERLVRDYEALVAQIEAPLARGLRLADACHRESWAQLALHIDRTRLMAKMLEALWLKGREAAEAPAEALRQWAREHEMRLQRVFDPYVFFTALDMILRGRYIP